MARNGKPEKEKDPFERVDACIRDLQDRHDYWDKITRSPATREAAMAGIVGELEGHHHLPMEALDMRRLTIFALCGVSIKKGTPREARHACRAVGLLLLTLCDGSPGPLLDVAFPALSKAFQAQDGAPPPPPTLAAAAIDCLAAASLAAGARHAKQAMEAIWRVIVPPVRSRSAKMKIRGLPKTSPAVLAAAVSAWTFLLTTVVSAASSTPRKADRASRSAAIASLAEILDADDRRVRMAAGEALVVCVELNLTSKGMEDVLAAKASDLAAESAGGKGADNSLLREQKELFGQIAAFLDHDEPPVTSVRASWESHAVIKVSTWVRLVQLSFLSKFLGNGFLKHVRGNPLLNEAFSFSRVEGKPLSIQKESSMRIGDLLRDLKHDWSWDRINIFGLPRWPGLMLHHGWH
ncbi:unnamed protein product [Urochloa decumbens]|uniref:Interferon-related developmental regulator N-terminal domain-containing protein n=1 Tax=Urochloa decumbens TaxID=240449 RepID=A0ABC8Z3L7_9POAL